MASKNVVSSAVWNHTQLGRFNWSWFDVTSFEPYKEETSYENSLLVQRTGGLALSSLVHVFRSLTPNAQGIFLLITGNQLEEKDNTTYIGETDMSPVKIFRGNKAIRLSELLVVRYCC